MKFCSNIVVISKIIFYWQIAFSCKLEFFLCISFHASRRTSLKNGRYAPHSTVAAIMRTITQLIFEQPFSCVSPVRYSAYLNIILYKICVYVISPHSGQYIFIKIFTFFIRIFLFMIWSKYILIINKYQFLFNLFYPIFLSIWSSTSWSCRHVCLWWQLMSCHCVQ